MELQELLSHRTEVLKSRILDALKEFKEHTGQYVTKIKLEQSDFEFPHVIITINLNA